MTLKGNKDMYLWAGEPGKVVIILISGKAGVGKTSMAEFIKDYLRDLHFSAYIVPFARGIKQCARFYFDWKGEKDTRGRKLLQQIGTEVGRGYDEDTWVKFLLTSLYRDEFEGDFVICDDWRFPNECSYIENTGDYEVVKIRVESPDREILKGTPEGNHISENSLPTAQDSGNYYNFIVENVSSLEDLKRDSINLVEQILKKEN